MLGNASHWFRGHLDDYLNSCLGLVAGYRRSIDLLWLYMAQKVKKGGVINEDRVYQVSSIFTGISQTVYQ